ncbi:hypothetical protein CMsap09_00410 [Clavibacter michiganensis]|uniref:Uncharacterized protein n=1 Tax=Clavibacter michiganensis TaxID=28447 RepID=A0A251XPE9_9MICO|nr:hypothetical protein CMsap09_00410 [Clavibacter michiganensis]
MRIEARCVGEEMRRVRIMTITRPARNRGRPFASQPRPGRIVVASPMRWVWSVFHGSTAPLMSPWVVRPSAATAMTRCV